MRPQHTHYRLVHNYICIQLHTSLQYSITVKKSGPGFLNTGNMEYTKLNCNYFESTLQNSTLKCIILQFKMFTEAAW